MPTRVAVPVQVIATSGILLGTNGALVTGDATNNHSYANGDGTTRLFCKNTHATDLQTVTVLIPLLVAGQAVASKVYTLAAGDELLLPYLQPSIFNQADGNVYFNVSASSVKFQVVA